MGPAWTATRSPRRHVRLLYIRNMRFLLHAAILDRDTVSATVEICDKMD
jgi:hypothetical protein